MELLLRMSELPRNKQGSRDKQIPDKSAWQADNNETFEEFGRWNTSSTLGQINRRNPQDQIPQDFGFLTTIKKPAQANIQGVGIHIVKLNINKNKNPDVMVTSG